MNKLATTFQSLLPNGDGTERNVPISSVEVKVPDDNKSNAVVSVGSLNGNEEGSIDTTSVDHLDQLDRILLKTKAASDNLIAQFNQGRKENLENFKLTHENQASIMENQKTASTSLDFLNQKMDFLMLATPNGRNHLDRLKKESEKKRRASQKRSKAPSSKPVVRGMDRHVKQQSQSTKDKAEAKKRDGRFLA